MDPHTPAQVRNWRRSLEERRSLLEQDANDPLTTPVVRAYRRGRISGLDLAVEMLDDLFGPEG